MTMAVMMMIIKMTAIADDYVSGARQGDTLSPFLFRFYVHGIITNTTELHRNGISQLTAKI